MVPPSKANPSPVLLPLPASAPFSWAPLRWTPQGHARATARSRRFRGTEDFMTVFSHSLTKDPGSSTQSFSSCLKFHRECTSGGDAAWS